MKLSTEQTKETPKRISLQELIARAESIKNRKIERVDLYVKSLEANIVIEEPDRNLCMDAVEMEDGGDAYIVANVVVNPMLKDPGLLAAFGAATPIELVEKLFKPGEATAIAKRALGLAGYERDSVKMVDEVKN